MDDVEDNDIGKNNRKNYSLNFKRKVIRNLREKYNGNVSVASREHKIARKNIIRWRNQMEVLEKAKCKSFT